MFTKENLEKLIENLESIINYTEKKGFTNIKIFKPLAESQKENLNFMVSVKDKNVSLFELAQLNNKLKKILNCEDIIVITENKFDPATKADYVGNSVLLSISEIDSIRALFGELLNDIKPVIETLDIINGMINIGIKLNTTEDLSDPQKIIDILNKIFNSDYQSLIAKKMENLTLTNNQNNRVNF